MCIVVFTWIFEDFRKMESMPTGHVWKSETEVSCLYKFSDCNKINYINFLVFSCEAGRRKYTCVFHFLPKFGF